MEKTATLNLRVNPVVKQRAEAVLARLGIPMSTAIDIYLNQIAMTGGIPFSLTLPRMPQQPADIPAAKEGLPVPGMEAGDRQKKEKSQ